MRRCGIFACQMGNQIHTIQLGIFGNLSQGDRSRGDIQRNHRMIVDASFGQGSRPTNNERDTNSSLGQHPFFSIERFVKRAIPPRSPSGSVEFVDFEWCAVVADKEFQSLLEKPFLFQGFSNEADAIIDRGDHRKSLSSSFRHLSRESIQIFGRRVERYVWCSISTIKEKRFACVFFDERRSGLRVCVQVIELGTFGPRFHTTPFEIDIRPAWTVSILVVDILKSMSWDLRGWVEMPFSRHACCVPRLSESFCDGLFCLKPRE